MSGYSYSSTRYRIFAIVPLLAAPLYTLREYIKPSCQEEQNNATRFLLLTKEQHEWCVAFFSRRHCEILHQTVPHNESRVTYLAVYSNILFYELDEASSNVVSSRGGIAAKCLFSCCCRFSALSKTH